MKPTDSTFGIAPGTMARMLAIGKEGERSDAHAASRTQLQRHKAQLLAVETGGVAEMLGGPCPQFASVTGRTLGSLLEEGGAPVEALEGAKQYAKRNSELHRQEPMRTVAAVLYYASVARALLDHDQKISRHGFKHLATSYAELHHMDWVGPQLGELFERTQEYCAAKATAVSDEGNLS